MSARSNNVWDMIEWLQSVMVSCENNDQQESAKRLVMLYVQKLIRERQFSVVSLFTINDITDYLTSFNYSGKLYPTDIHWEMFSVNEF